MNLCHRQPGTLSHHRTQGGKGSCEEETGLSNSEEGAELTGKGEGLLGIGNSPENALSPEVLGCVRKSGQFSWGRELSAGQDLHPGAMRLAGEDYKACFPVTEQKDRQCLGTSDSLSVPVPTRRCRSVTTAWLVTSLMMPRLQGETR